MQLNAIYVAARTKPLVPGDPVHANWHGTWYPGHVLEVRDDDVIVYWAEAQHQLRTYTTTGDITRNSGGVPMDPKLTQIKNGEICSSAKADRHWPAMPLEEIPAISHARCTASTAMYQPRYRL